MARTLFHSTVEEKRLILDRLKNGPKHADIDLTIRIVEDALLLHEAHKTLSYVTKELQKRNVIGDLPGYIPRFVTENIQSFYSRVSTQKIIKKRKGLR